MSLKKKIGIAKQRVSPKVQANAELVNQVIYSNTLWFVAYSYS